MQYDRVCLDLLETPRQWLVTGAAGFIGSHLTQKLLELDQTVIGLDNFSTGYEHNVDQVRAAVGLDRAARYRFIEADIRDPYSCRAAVRNVDVILHQAALGSVPRSVEDPLTSHASNVDGFINLLVAAKDAGVRRVVYASSSSVYGDDPSDRKSEEHIGCPISPYAATKRIDELYAQTFGQVYGLDCVGLRYFNVFGPRQDPEGPYAAVIPRWTEHLLSHKPCVLYGDGEKSRDFCYVDNVVQGNLLAAMAAPETLTDRVFNIACGERTTLHDLFSMIRAQVAKSDAQVQGAELEKAEARAGDIAHSLADISRARRVLAYEPSHTVQSGLTLTVPWFVERANAKLEQGEYLRAASSNRIG